MRSQITTTCSGFTKDAIASTVEHPGCDTLGDTCPYSDPTWSSDHIEIDGGQLAAFDPELLKWDESYVNKRRDCPLRSTAPYTTCTEGTERSDSTVTTNSTQKATYRIEPDGRQSAGSPCASVDSCKALQGESLTMGRLVHTQQLQGQCSIGKRRLGKGVICAICAASFQTCRIIVDHIMKQHNASPYTCLLPSKSDLVRTCQKLF